jgi:endoglucanase
MPLTMNKISAAAFVVGLFAVSVASAEPAPSPRVDPLPRISVKGNRFVDPSGSTVLFRGLSIADPADLVARGQWNRELFAAIKGMGANLVRLPVHPLSWRSRGREGYLVLLDQAVAWCTELGMHVIIDWHSIGNLQSGLFQPSDRSLYETTKVETFDFWRTASMHFHGNSTVAFYELFNEPTHFNGMLGTMTWSEWRDLNEEMIGIIRFSDKEAIPLVAGFDWAYDDTGFRYEPIRAGGIGYVTHPYPNKRSQPWEPRWDEDFAFMAGTYPMIATEIGFELKPGDVDTEDYRNRITRFLEARGISWMAWVFDPDWTPRMLKSWTGYQLSDEGEFFKGAMTRPPAFPPPKGK